MSNQCPIVGTRWHLVGKDYDLCDAEYQKLPADKKKLFVAIDVPSDAADAVARAHAAASVAAAPAPQHPSSSSPPPPPYDPRTGDPNALAAAADAALKEAIARSLEDVTADVVLPPEVERAQASSPAPASLESFPSLDEPPTTPIFESDDENELVLVSNAANVTQTQQDDDEDELALKQALAASLLEAK